MSNFKSLKELYQALLDGKTIICENGTKAKMIDDNELEVDQAESPINKRQTARMPIGNMFISDCTAWSIYQESEVWYRVTYHKKNITHPWSANILYKSEQDFLEYNSFKKEDCHWIHLEEFKRG